MKLLRDADRVRCRYDEMTDLITGEYDFLDPSRRSTISGARRRSRQSVLSAFSRHSSSSSQQYDLAMPDASAMVWPKGSAARHVNRVPVVHGRPARPDSDLYTTVGRFGVGRRRRASSLGTAEKAKHSEWVARQKQQKIEE